MPAEGLKTGLISKQQAASEEPNDPGTRRLDVRVRVVSFEVEILVAEVVNGSDLWIEDHLRQRSRIVEELLAGQSEMALAEVSVGDDVHQLTQTKLADLTRW